MRAAAVERQRLLSAIAQVETGTTDTNRPSRRVGRGGERSAWQISADNWSRYTRAPFIDASLDARLASTVASLHMEWLVNQLLRAGMDPTPYALALAWNAGPTGVTRHRAPAAAHAYAVRVIALYDSAP
jgi:hypothetical protein